jgi:hypothetical protein
MAFGSSVWVAWRFALAKVADPRTRVLIVVAFATAPAALYPLLYDVHPNVVAVPFVMLTLFGFATDRVRLVILAGVAASLLREDVALALVIFGLLNLRTRTKQAVPLIVIGLSAMVLWLALPRGPSFGYGIFYGYIDPSHPVETLARIPGVVWAGGLLVLWAIAVFLPWIISRGLDWRPLLVVLVAGAPYLLAESAIAKTVAFQYWALAPVFLFAAAVHTGATVVGVRRTAFGMFTALAFLGGPFVTGLLGSGGFGLTDLERVIAERRPLVVAAHRAVSCIDPDATVAMMSQLTPLTGHFREVRLLPAPFEDLTGEAGDVMQQADPDLEPTFLLANEIPSAATAYTRSPSNPLVWYREDVESSAIERCLMSS